MMQLGRGGHLADGTDTLVAFLPFFHIYGLTAVMLDGIRCGATIVVMSRFDMEAYFALVKRHRATVLHVVPPIVLALAKHPSVDPQNFASVRKLFSGAAPLSRDVIEPCLARLGCTLQQGYGMTEASPCTHMTPTDAPETHGTVGVVCANTECCLMADGRVLGPGEGDGEVCVRGPQVMRGYLNKPEATAATIDADGWLHTGDIGRIDDRGYLTIVDRLKELIKYKGLQVAPAELEASLLSHPAVADAAVVPYPDADAGEVPKAFVVLKGEATADELIAFVAAHHAPHKKIRQLEFIDKIPKSASGKILRRVLRDRDAR
jgi:acyl-CoA synthetase (AMP-forming)/AMP-acid ligase II